MLFYSKNLLGHRLLVWPTLFCLKSFSNQSECLNQTTLNVSFINCWDAVEMVYALQVKLVQTVCGWVEMLIADRLFCFANKFLKTILVCLFGQKLFNYRLIKWIDERTRDPQNDNKGLYSHFCGPFVMFGPFLYSFRVFLFLTLSLFK